MAMQGHWQALARASRHRSATAAQRPWWRRGVLVLIAASLAACSTSERLGDAQVRPMDRPECQVGSQRRDLDAGVPALIGGTGCRGNPDATQSLNRQPANAVELGRKHD
jgi:hypothetical protein